MVSAMYRTTARSWEIITKVRPCRCCRSFIRLRIWAWIDTSSADTGSSATMSLGSRARARARPMRWRWPPENSCGYRSTDCGLRPDFVEQRLDPVPLLVAELPTSLHLEWLADDGADPHPRVERGVRVLEHELEVPPPMRGVRRPVSRLTSRHPRSGWIPSSARSRATRQPADGRLAAARLAHQSEGLAPADGERDVGHRLDRSHLVAEDASGHHRELLDQVVDRRGFRGRPTGRADRSRRARCRVRPTVTGVAGAA